MPRGSRVTARAIQAAEREAQALALRRQGYHYAEIAAELGINNIGTAWALVHRGYRRLLRHNEEQAEYNRRLDLERLDVALKAIWPHVEAGKGWAIDRLLGILDRRAKLLGLDRRPAAEAPSDLGEVLAAYLVRRAMTAGRMLPDGHPGTITVAG